MQSNPSIENATELGYKMAKEVSAAQVVWEVKINRKTLGRYGSENTRTQVISLENPPFNHGQLINYRFKNHS